MEPQKSGKRSLALPVTLIILVFSLIGNVFLYSQFLQHKQQIKHDTGQRIYNAAVSSQQYASEMIPLLDALLQSKTLDDRLGLVYNIGKLSAKGGGLTELAAEAAAIADDSAAWDTTVPAMYVSNAEAGLLAAGRYEGALNDSDASYVTELKSSYVALNGVLGEFNANIGETRIAVIRLASGLDWMELAKQSMETMAGQAARSVK